jgi:fatty-acyl-CoA synthase
MRALVLRHSDARANYQGILDAARFPDQALAHVIHLGTGEWNAMLANGSGLPSAPVRASDVTNIQYTSGTTGSPNGALLTHRNLVNNGGFTGECLGMTERDKMCVSLPLILPSTSFDPLALLEAVQAEPTTVTAYHTRIPRVG